MFLDFLFHHAEQIQKNYEEVGVASHYKSQKTASGRRFRNKDLIAAHKHLPFGTKVKVTNLRNNKSVIVEIIDRGPYVRGRIIDLSTEAALEIGILNSGIGKVKIEIVS